MSLRNYLPKVIRKGALKVRLPSGETLEAGDGSGPQVAVAVTSNLWAL
jgi:hypothetical protein